MSARRDRARGRCVRRCRRRRRERAAAVAAPRSRRADAASLRVGVAKPGGGYTVIDAAARRRTSRACWPARPRATAAGGARGARDHRSAPSRSPIAAVIAPTDSISAIRRTVRCCAPPTPATERAAQATAGRVLLRDGAPASIYYTASCGGRTEKPSAVWPGAEDPPFLPSQDDDACQGAPAWTAEMQAADLLRALRAAGFRGDRLRDVRIALAERVGPRRAAEARRSAAGRRSPVRICGSRSAARSGWQHIKSTAFDLRRAGRRVPVQRSRIGPRRRHVRHRIGAARRAGDDRGRHPRALFPGPADLPARCGPVTTAAGRDPIDGRRGARSAPVMTPREPGPPRSESDPRPACARRCRTKTKGERDAIIEADARARATSWRARSASPAPARHAALPSDDRRLRAGHRSRRGSRRARS